ncbi:MAG: efflux RND transporter periplasmic adaptor subunit, partial [Pirellulales bacterium]|nr:efflux RND transporter periplasmic adaptor subunit [Pirellulales bacterium]
MPRHLSHLQRYLALVAAAAVGLLFLAYGQLGLYGTGHAGGGEPRKAALGYSAKALGERPEEVSGVETVSVESSPSHQTLHVTGQLAADELSDIGNRLPGIIAEVLVERGSTVEKGDVLARIDPADAENALAEGLSAAEELRVRLMLESADSTFEPELLPDMKLARASLDLAKSNLERTTSLHERKVLSQEVFDQVRAEYQSALYRVELVQHQARQLYQSYRTALTHLKTLQKSVHDTTITAPFQGWVVEKHVAVGERLGTGEGARVVTLIRTDPLRLTLTVPQQHVHRIQVGQPVEFQVDAFPERKFTGQVRYVAPAVESAGRSLTVEAVVSNPDRLLKPGLFATARLQLEQETTALYVPATAVQQHGDAGRVFVVRDGVVREQVVAVGRADGGRVRVTSGLAAGERVV